MLAKEKMLFLLFLIEDITDKDLISGFSCFAIITAGKK
jgi:hypothetical protein